MIHKIISNEFRKCETTVVSSIKFLMSVFCVKLKKNVIFNFVHGCMLQVMSVMFRKKGKKRIEFGARIVIELV